MQYSPFVLPVKEYKRDLGILKHYVEDTATYLAKMTGKSLEACLAYVKKQLQPGGKFEFKDPTATYLERKENGDRIQTEGPLSKYIGDAIRTQSLIAATLTIYDNPQRQRSYLVDFIDTNVKKRGVAKKAMFAAEMAGDTFEYAYRKGEQGNKKTNNNSISGGHAQPSTPLYNKTAHSTLTSTCRSTSGYGNANNEKFLCGNRHYWSPHVVRNNITSIINLIDMVDLQNTMNLYGIRYPTADETMECIRYSTQLYWRGIDEMAKLRRYVDTLTNIERAAFVYIGDFYQLAKLNDGPIRAFIDKLSQHIDTPLDGGTAYMKSAPEEYRHLATLLCPQQTRGKQTHQLVDTPEYNIVAATTKNIADTLEEYRPLIKTICLSPSVPASLAKFPDSIRRSAMTSDTDSTIFTVQDWVTWHRGEMGFDQKSNASADVMVFLASQSIVHVLARMSANFGIEEARLFQIAMKNEFKFDVFVPTQVAKHYFALISSQEGNLFNEFKKEIKGVHLKSSNVPKKIVEHASKMMVDIMNTVVSNEKISITPILKEIADIERDIIKSISVGSYEYFRVGQIKPESSYGRPGMESNYWYYLFWEKVFAPKYGHSQLPPYMAVKVSIELDSPTKLKRWMESFEDRALAARMEAFLKLSNRSRLTTIWMPEQCINSVGIPPEILSQVDVRKIVFSTVKIHYIVLETLGIYMTTGNISKLCSDYY